MEDDFQDVLLELVHEMKNVPSRDLDAPLHAILCVSGKEPTSIMTPHVIVTAGTQEEHSSLESLCRRNERLTNFLQEHEAELSVIVGNVAQAASSSDLPTLPNVTTAVRAARCKLLVPRSEKGLCGFTLEMRSLSGSYVCHCTVGGFVCVGTHLFGWTARHCLDSISGLDQHSVAKAPIPMPKSQDQLDDYDAFDVELLHPEVLGTGVSQYQGFDYDWALVDVSKLPPRVFMSTIPEDGVRNQLVQSALPARTTPKEDVTVLLPGAHEIHGHMNSFPAVITLAGKMHCVKIIEMSQPLPKGSSGAWVSFENQLCGFIIAVQEESSWAYMIPVHDAFEDVKNCTGEQVRIATPKDLDQIATAGSKSLNTTHSQHELDASYDSTPVPGGIAISQDSLSGQVWGETTSESFQVMLRTTLSGKDTPARPLSASRFLRYRRPVKRLQEWTKELLCRTLPSKPKTATGHSSGTACCRKQGDLRPEKQLLLFDGADLHQRATRDEDDVSGIPWTSSLSLGSHNQPYSSNTTSEMTHGEASMVRAHVQPEGFRSPRKVVLRLLVSYNGSPMQYVGQYRFQWLAYRHTFWEIKGMVELLLKERGLSPTAKAYLRSGICRLLCGEIGEFQRASMYGGPTDRLFDSTIVESESQWIKNVSSLVLRFVALNRDDPFYLETCWEIIQLHPGPTPLPGRNRAELMLRLLENNRQRNWTGQLYVPQKALRNIMSPALITHVLQSDKSVRVLAGRQRTLADLGAYVFNSAWRLMAVIISARLPPGILFHLWRYDLTDAKLPLKSDMRPAGIEEEAFRRIVSWQYAFVALSFGGPSRTKPLRFVSEDTVVPMSFKPEADCIGIGSSAEVFKVHLDPEHHNLSHGTSIFAVKCMKGRFRSDEETKRRTQRIFLNLSMVQHDHLVVPVISWLQKERLFMLFPHASSNLHSFLRNAPVPNLSRDVTLGFLGELRAIADALRHIHNLGPSGLAPIEIGSRPSGSAQTLIRAVGFHHDIKPENILVFSRSATSVPSWKLSDFGMTRVSQAFVGFGSEGEVDALQAHSAAYSAPDHVMGHEPSRPFDVWALGCVYLEILLWMCGGLADLDKFSDERRAIDGSESFWYHTQNGVLRKPAVIASLSKLRRYVESRGVFEPLLDAVENMLVIDPGARDTAPTVLNNMDAILFQANVDLSEDDFYLADRTTINKLAAPPESATMSSSCEHADMGVQTDPIFEDDEVLDLEDGLRDALARRETGIPTAWTHSMSAIAEAAKARHDGTIYYTASDHSIQEPRHDLASLATSDSANDNEPKGNSGDLAGLIDAMRCTDPGLDYVSVDSSEQPSVLSDQSGGKSSRSDEEEFLSWCEP